MTILISCISTQLLSGEIVTLQRSTNLIGWEPYFVFDGTFPEDDPTVLTTMDYGSFLEIQFKLEHIDGICAEFYRLAVNPGHGIASQIPGL